VSQSTKEAVVLASYGSSRAAYEYFEKDNWHRHTYIFTGNPGRGLRIYDGSKSHDANGLTGFMRKKWEEYKKPIKQE
jgi:hypothetical protein